MYVDLLKPMFSGRGVIVFMFPLHQHHVLSSKLMTQSWLSCPIPSGFPSIWLIWLTFSCFPIFKRNVSLSSHARGSRGSTSSNAASKSGHTRQFHAQPRFTKSALLNLNAWGPLALHRGADVAFLLDDGSNPAHYTWYPVDL